MPEAPKDGSVAGSVPGRDFIHPCFFCRAPCLQCCALSRARTPGKPTTLLSRSNRSWRWRKSRCHAWRRQHQLTRNSGRSILGERPLRSTFVFRSVCRRCALFFSCFSALRTVLSWMVLVCEGGDIAVMLPPQPANPACAFHRDGRVFVL